MTTRFSHAAPLSHNFGQRHAMMDDANGNGITLDGKPAMVAGLQLAFPFVIDKADHSRKIEIAWATLARVLQTSRNVNSH